MNRERFFDSLKAGEVLPCYLFEGEEEYTKESALHALREQVLSGGFADLNSSVLVDPPVDALIACAETLPMMADKRFILVKDSAHLLAAKAGQGNDDKKGSKGDEADRLVSYLSNLPQTVCLVFFMRGKANGTRKVYKQIAKQGGVVSFDPLEQKTMVKWMAKELKGYGKQIDHQTAEQLIFAVGNDMHRLSQELGKLAASAGDREGVMVQDIQDVCAVSTEYRVFDLSDALVSGQTARASALMQDMLREGEQRLMLLSLLQRQYRQLLFLRILTAQKLPQDEIARQLAAPPFVVRKLQPLAARYSMDALKKAYDLLIETEFLVKSGQIPEEGSLEQAVYRLLALQMEGRRDA